MRNYFRGGIAVDLDEQKRLVNDLGEHHAMILNSHGLLTAGRTVGECFQIMLRLERACAAQIAALSGGGDVRTITDASITSTHATIDQMVGDYSRDWSALLRLAYWVDPAFVKASCLNRATGRENRSVSDLP